MKSASTLWLVLALAGASVTAQAQTRPAPRKAVAPKQKIVLKEGNTMKDGAMMREGKVLFTQQGQTNPITEPVTLVNGTKIMADGTVTMPDGSTAMLKEGDMVSLSGRLSTRAMKAEQDSLAMAAQMGKKGKVKIKKK